MPLGSSPSRLSVGAGKPVATTPYSPAAPTRKVVLLAPIRAGASATVSTKLWLLSVPTPLLAPKVSPYRPPVPALGVPSSAPVAGVNVIPAGKLPLSESDGAGVPVAVTVKLPALPTVKVVLLAELIRELSSMFRLKGRLAGLPMPLFALNVSAYVPLVPAAGVPERMPVCASKDSPSGKLPLALS